MNNPIELSHDFFFGGRAKFTVESQKTGEWRTYRIGKGKPSPAYPKPAWFVSLLSGPDNENSFTVHHEGKCGCCGRSLTVPESIKRGIGPECWSRMA